VLKEKTKNYNKNLLDKDKEKGEFKL